MIYDMYRGIKYYYQEPNYYNNYEISEDELPESVSEPPIEDFQETAE